MAAKEKKKVFAALAVNYSSLRAFSSIGSSMA
jgi:hypothetical protein